MISYTDGTWSIDKFGNIIAGGDTLLLGGVSTPMVAGASKDEAKENARRIVACVNACAGVDTDLLEAGELDKPTMLVMQENKDLKRSCNELLAALEAAVECKMVPATSAKEGGAAKYSIQVQVADRIRDVIAKAKGGLHGQDEGRV